MNDEWRQIEGTDACCNSTGNLRQAEQVEQMEDGYFYITVIDGVWICSECARLWIGRGSDEYLNHPLKTLTEDGVERFFSAMGYIIKEGRTLNLENTIDRITFADKDLVQKFCNNFSMHICD